MRDKPKNPAAVALGRLGGSVKNPRKGFGSRPDAQAKAQASRRANRATPASRQA